MRERITCFGVGALAMLFVLIGAEEFLGPMTIPGAMPSPLQWVGQVISAVLVAAISAFVIINGVKD